MTIRQPSLATRIRSRFTGWRSSLITIIGLLISIALFLIVLRQVDLQVTWQNLKRLSPAWLAIPLIAGLVSLLFRAWRWQRIFPADIRPSLWISFKALSLGNVLNLLLPARAGDVARCFLSCEGQPKARVGTAIAALGLEKVLDGLASLLVLVVAWWFFTPPAWFQRLSVAAALLFVGALLFLFALRLRAGWVIGPIRWFSSRVGQQELGGRVERLVNQFLAGLEVIASPRQMIVLGFLTSCVWLCEAFAVLGLASALGLRLGVLSAVVTSSVLALGMMIPSAPGYVGTYEFFAVSALQMFAIAPEQGLALTLVMHGWVYGMIVIVGIAVWVAGGLEWSQIQRIARLPDQPEKD